jgi:capsule polysaccharide export protein KpsE/RkpR
MDSELRKNIRIKWFESLFELSHYDFQRKVWLEAGIENYVSDYTEAVCKYFDDLDLGEGLEKFVSEGFISNQEANIFFEFHKQLEEYVDQTEKKGMSDTEILEDIEWINLTKTAKKNWGKLKEILNVEMELDYVNVLENNFANAT